MDFQLRILNTKASIKNNSLGNYFLKLFIDNKLNNIFGFILFFIATAAITFFIAKLGLVGGILALALLIGIPAIFLSIFNIKAGITITLTLSFFVLGLKRVAGDVQLGVLMDLLVAIMAFGMFIKQSEKKDWSFAKNPISKIILVWVLYNLLEFVNPSVESRLAWVYVIRSFAGIMVFYFLLIYSIKSKKDIAWFIKIWIVLAIAGMLYGYYQEYFGFFPFEMNWIMSSQERFALLFQAGKFRKFSFFSDPLVFGFLMSITGTLCWTLLLGPFKKYTKVFLFLIGLLMFNAMLFSGTRAAFILPPLAMIFYTILTLKRKLIILTAVIFLLGMVLINVSTSNANLVRLQSAFHPSEDASYQVRVKNQAFIKPFIQKHPLGAGLGSVGEWGKKFSPWSPIAQFPPDSGFIRIAVETGWVGLFIYCTFLFIVLRIGIMEYIRIKDPELKTYSLGMLLVAFCLTVANFPQEAIGQYPINLIFFVAIGVLTKIKEFDNETVINYLL